MSARFRDRGLLTLSFVLVAASAPSATGDSHSVARAPEPSWWRGTVAIEESWSRENAVGLVASGEATLRITRTQRTSAEYELAYVFEERFPDTPGQECRGELRERDTSSMRGAAPISMATTGLRGGTSFSVTTGLSARLVREHYDCSTGELIEQDVDELRPGVIGFFSKQSPESRAHRGSVQPENGVFYPYSGRKVAGRPNRTTITWNLQLVAPPPPTGEVRLGRPTLRRPRPSFLEASVRVTQDTTPVLARAVACKGTFPSDPRYGADRRGLGHARTGEAQCAYGFNNARYNGKVFAASIAVAVGRTTVTRRFSVRIGDGTSLSSASGATIRR